MSRELSEQTAGHGQPEKNYDHHYNNRFDSWIHVGSIEFPGFGCRRSTAASAPECRLRLHCVETPLLYLTPSQPRTIDATQPKMRNLNLQCFSSSRQTVASEKWLGENIPRHGVVETSTSILCV